MLIHPHYFCLPSNEPLAFAGLWEVWEDKNTASVASPYKSCTIITIDASESVKDIHNRMPIILQPESNDEWLDPQKKELGEVDIYAAFLTPGR